MNVIRDFDALDAISWIPFVQDGSALGALRDLNDAVGPDMPDDLVATPVSSSLKDAKVMHYNYDEGHAGRYSVPNTSGGSVAFDWVMDQKKPAEYVMSNLAFRDLVDEPKGYQDGTEFVVFCPGLNTVHQPREGETTTVERLRHYVKVLGPYPMAQIHTGTSFDQGDVDINASRAPMLRAILSMIPDQAKPKESPDGHLKWDARQIDSIQLTLSQYNIFDTPLKDGIKKLLETSLDSRAPPVVLIVYSRASIECEAALRKHVEESLRRESREKVEARLRKRVTIVTVGSASHDYPDGPAYIHLSAWNDPLSKDKGVNAKNNVSGAGKDALFLNCDSPYHPDAFDNHNFGAVTSQFLSLVMYASKATGFRDLWEKAQEGKLVIPDDTDGVTRAMIMLTRGYEWLWSESDAWKDIPMGALPDQGGAAALLREKMGTEFVDRVTANFGTN